MMSGSIRYFRQGKDGYAGVLIIPEMEIVTHKARLKASGYVVLDGHSTTAVSKVGDDLKK